MSFNSTDKSGEAVPFHPEDFLQFVGLGGVSSILRTPLGGISSGLTRKIIDQTAKFEREQAKPGGIITQLKNLLTPKKAAIVSTTGGTVLVGSQATKPLFTTGTKVLTGLGLTAATAGLVTLTPGGQDAAKSAADLAGKGLDIGKDFSEFLKANGQLLSIFLIVGAVALVVGAVKK